ncbi:MAG: tetratricopeptide repeat protein [Planctomycetota bacterium]
MPTIEELEKLLEADPRDTFVLYGLAQEHEKTGNHAEAVGYYDRCLEADPAYSYAYFHKARTLLNMNETLRARDTLAAGLRAARAAGDAHAADEIAGFLQELDG